MSTSSSLSSAKRRRAGGVDGQRGPSNLVNNTTVDDGTRLMSVQDVLYMLHNKIEMLNNKLVNTTEGESNSQVSPEVITTITDSIDNMNETIGSFTSVLEEYNNRLQTLEKNTLEEKVNMLEKRINEKILAKTSSNRLDLLSKKPAPAPVAPAPVKVQPPAAPAPVKVQPPAPVKVQPPDAPALVKLQPPAPVKVQPPAAPVKVEPAAPANKDENIKISFSSIKKEIETNNK